MEIGMKRIVLGFQHVLAMFGATVTVPLVVGSAIEFPLTDIAVMIQAVLLAMGIATLLQTFIGSKFPIVQGYSFAFIPGLIAIGSGIELAAVEGALIVGGVIEELTGALGLILASSLVLGLGAPQLPAEFRVNFPQIIASIIVSGMTVGSISAIIMDQLLK
jgi:xanthine/uracil permease